MEENIINNTQFDLINSEEERKYLAENLNNFSILNLNNLSDKDNYIVKGASELLKVTILSSQSSKLFKSKCILIDSEKTNNYIYDNVFEYLILKMNEKLECIINKLKTDKILIQTEKEKKQKVRDIISMVCRLKSAINSSRINDDFELKELNTLKEQAQDFNNYYIKKYENIFEQFPNEIYFYFPLCYFYYFPPIRLIQHIRRIKLFEKLFKEFYLINNLYELSLETLIYINIALCNYYIKTSNFKEADSIINEMFDSNSLFNNNVKKVKDMQKIKSEPSRFVGSRLEFTYGAAYFDFHREQAEIWFKVDAYLKNNFCSYIELLKDLKTLMSEEIYILEINDIKYLIFKNNLYINDIGI
ncbi:hypothetical protein [Brachyspira hampsonii]|uniref:Uncharacterized protein n=1 Tax=Brachyspira hampsonii TaxID=1287055 RepID=A0AAC9XKB7_9SPIR|nr:hypothetical protein [Brachyspira hampsonii]ASJ21672.1 hypothetical protein BHAMNSH16_08485 [Brachyspira hampsonii]ELV05715.1 hypothetical protein H263_08554 [Brachyspira hampsonii 30599]OEJ12931.1 hypothetical protein A9496_03060 [Brachyspira hampsonii]